MKCEEVQNTLSEYIDNELCFENLLIFKAHIDTCEQCNRDLIKAQQLKQQLKTMVMPQLSDSFDAKLLAHINEANSKSHFRKLLPLAASIALIVPLAGLVKLSMFQTPSDAQNELIIELQSIGKVSSIEDFHKWTQLNDSGKRLVCENSAPGSHCSIDLSYSPQT